MLEHGIILLIAFCFSKKVKSFAILGDVLYVFNLQENKYKYKSTNSYWKFFLSCNFIFFFLKIKVFNQELALSTFLCYCILAAFYLLFETFFFLVL